MTGKAALWIVLLGVVGWLVPRYLTGDGIARFCGDPATTLVARDAYAGAWQLQDGPRARILTPAARVVEVTRAARGLTGALPGAASGRPRLHPVAPGAPRMKATVAAFYGQPLRERDRLDEEHLRAWIRSVDRAALPGDPPPRRHAS